MPIYASVPKVPDVRVVIVCVTAVVVCVQSLPEVWLSYPAMDAEPCLSLVVYPFFFLLLWWRGMLGGEGCWL